MLHLLFICGKNKNFKKASKQDVSFPGMAFLELKFYKFG